MKTLKNYLKTNHTYFSPGPPKRFGWIKLFTSVKPCPRFKWHYSYLNISISPSYDRKLKYIYMQLTWLLTTEIFFLIWIYNYYFEVFSIDSVFHRWRPFCFLCKINCCCLKTDGYINFCHNLSMGIPSYLTMNFVGAFGWVLPILIFRFFFLFMRLILQGPATYWEMFSMLKSHWIQRELIFCSMPE